MSCKNRAKPCKLFVSCKKSCSCHAKKRASCSTCHARCSTCEKNKLFHMQKPCKTVQKNQHVKMTCLYVHAKTMQKPCKMRRVRSANPPNIHSPRVPCYVCYMCYMALYSTYTTNFRAYRIYSTYSTYSKDPGESGGSAAWRVRYSTYSTYSKDPGESGGSAAWRGRNVNTSSTSGTCVELVPLVLKLSESNFGGSSM